jgi:ABC-type lipoprotein export system ATPase subunit
MVTHDPRSAAYGDEVLLLRDGQLASTLDLRDGKKVDHANRSGNVLKWLEKLDGTGAVRKART